MPKITKSCSHRSHTKTKCTFLRFLVIILSFISLISRIIYSTYATWLTITTFDCIPCANSTSSNASSDLFIAHHSSAIFKTIRDLNIKSEIVSSESKSRAKRSDDNKDLINSNRFLENFSQFFDSNDYSDLKQNAEKLAKQLYKSTDNGSASELNSTQTQSQLKQEFLSELFGNHSESDYKNVNSVQNLSETMFSSFFDDEPQNQSQIKDQEHNEEHILLIPIVAEDPAKDGKANNETAFEGLTDIPDLDSVIAELFDSKNVSTGADGSVSRFNVSLDSNDLFTNFSNEDNLNDMTVLLSEGSSNATNQSIDEMDPKRQPKSLNDDQQVKGSSYDLTVNRMNVCSEDCGQFLSVELSDPDMRKWATIVITGVLYMYALVMFSIFMGSCLALVDLLVIATFIEGAKLFAGFILIIIDSFNGKEIHFNLIDIKFNVNSGGNGWTADFSYSEYLLDIIIFFLSTFLCIRVFKCFQKQPKKVSSVEELADTRGTYRPNHSRNSLEPIFERN